MVKVLVGIPTYEKERYALVPVLQGLQKQLFQDFDVLAVDNSDVPGYDLVVAQALQTAFPKKKTAVEHISVDGGKFDKILASRKFIREHFLMNEEYTHLFFLDSDVLLQKTALARLLARRKQLVTGVYLSLFRKKNKAHMLPVLWIDVGGEKARQATIREVLKGDLIEIGAAGMGCTLIAREVIEKVDFRIARGTEDVPFYRDAVKELGIQPYADCKVKCLHLNHPLGDPANEPYNLPKYRLK